MGLEHGMWVGETNTFPAPDRGFNLCHQTGHTEEKWGKTVPFEVGVDGYLSERGNLPSLISGLSNTFLPCPASFILTVVS